jgi:nitrate reductase beta subunit
MTAVEWLEQQLYSGGWEKLTHEEKMNICCTAKLKEQQQIINAHAMSSIESGFENSAYDWANTYYNEKFKIK